MISTPSLAESTYEAVRGVASARPEVMPVAQGVIIGLGGSGVQTVSRVKSMIDSGRPEAAATSALSILGIDAVPLALQEPKLPNGVTLDAHEFVHLTETPFDPSALVRSQGMIDSPLHNWFDFERSVPQGPLGTGLKQDRMLGRLVYYREGRRLVQRITEAFVASARVTTTRTGKGQADDGISGGRPRVFIVASMCGGTGSSGLLEVVHKVWVAARGMGLTPDIRLFLYMPGVFESAARNSSDPTGQVRNMRSNAYGFLRELDHFITHSDQLPAEVCDPSSLPPIEIEPGLLVDQVYLVDRQLTNGQFVTSITDAYEIVASAVYQLLMTAVGTQMAVNGVNVDQLLREYDGYGKRRIYCGLGLSCITYPGETLRRHLAFRFADWVIREQLLATPVDLPKRVGEHPASRALLDRLKALRESVTTFEREPSVRSYVRLCESAPEQLAADNASETVGRLMATVRNDRARVLGILGDQLRTQRAVALSQVPAEIQEAVLSTGEGVPFGVHLLKRVGSQLADLNRETRAAVARTSDAVSRMGEEMDAAERALNGRVGWRSWMGARDTSAKELGEAVAAYGKASVEHAMAQAASDFLRSAFEVVASLQGELEGAVVELQQEASRMSAAWHSDEFVGKDAGPRELTALIPADVRPEVEDSDLARTAFDRVLTAMAQVEPEELVGGLYRAWRTNGRGRAPFDLGSASKDLSSRARAALLDELTKLAGEHALQAGQQSDSVDGASTAAALYLPRSLEEAAARVDHGRSLDLALTSMEHLAGQVLLPVDSTKLNSPIECSPSTAVSRPRSLADKVTLYVPERDGVQVRDWADEERVQVFTTVWGASAHALTAVPTWRQAYEETLRIGTRDKSKASHRPPHLSRHFSGNMDPLEPEYRDDEMFALVVVHALMAGKLLADPAVSAAMFGEDPPRGVAGVPLAAIDLGDRVAWHAALFDPIPDSPHWAARQKAFDFGSRYRDLLESVGANLPFKQNVDAFAREVLKVAGRKAAIAALQELKSGKFDPALAGGAADPRERDVLNKLRYAADRQIARYRADELIVA